MALVYTLDASVMITAFSPDEPDYEQSFALLREVSARGLPLVEPSLLIPEIGGTLGRRQMGPELARRFIKEVASRPGLNLVALDGLLARQAAILAIDQRLRGADAVYAAVALRFGATLVTRDREQLNRAGAVVQTLTPAAALSELLG